MLLVVVVVVNEGAPSFHFCSGYTAVYVPEGRLCRDWAGKWRNVRGEGNNL